MPANDIETKVEAAMVAYLQSETGFITYRGLEPEIRELPAVFAHCGSVIEAPIDTGNYQCEVTAVIICKAQRDTEDGPDPLAAFRFRLATVRDALNWTDLADRLTLAGSDFTCMFALDRGGDTAVDSDNLVATIKRELHCCGTAGL